MNDIPVVVGPVIIEGEKVLLVQEKKDYGVSPWFFPGGRIEDGDTDLETACRREVKEELGIDIEILRPLQTLTLKRPDKAGMVKLVHYLARRIGDVQPGKNIVAWSWQDIKNLPTNCGPNIYEIIKDLT